MRRTKPAPASRLRFSALWLACALLVSAAATAEAQSGRRKQQRGSSGTTSSSPLPTSTPAQPAEASQPAPPVKAAPAQPQTPLLLVSDIPQRSYFSFPFPERMRTWVAKRLRDSGALSVMEGEPSSRSEAIKHAKSSKDTFVVWVQLDESGFRPAPGGTNLEEVRISYYVYNPETGKTKSSGVVYLNSGRQTIDLGVGRVGLPCYPGVSGRDYLLLRASLEVADRILSVFNLPRPSVCN